MATEEKCDIENPCEKNLICDLDIGRCFPTVEEPLPPGIIQTNLEGRRFVGYVSTIMKVIASYYGKMKEITCSTGLDVILYEEFNDKIFTKLQDDYSDLISFVDIESGKILCSIKSQLIQYWNAKADSYRGFEAQPGEDINDKKLDIMRGERDHTNYLNFDMWTTKFITENQAEKVLDSQDNLFLLIPIQFRYYDTNPSRIGAHHNFDTGGDSLYLVAGIKTIGKELIEVEEEEPEEEPYPMEIIEELISHPTISQGSEEYEIVIDGLIKEYRTLFPFMSNEEQQEIIDNEMEMDEVVVQLILDSNKVKIRTETDAYHSRNYSELPLIWRKVYENGLAIVPEEESEEEPEEELSEELQNLMQIIGEVFVNPRLSDIRGDRLAGVLIIDGFIRIKDIFPFMIAEDEQRIINNEMEEKKVEVELLIDSEEVKVETLVENIRLHRRYLNDLPDIWRKVYEAWIAP
jgi:hypothetical protein